MVNEEIKEHIKKAISVSNNESHKYLVNYIGKETLKSYGFNMGATNTLIGGDSYGNTSPFHCFGFVDYVSSHGDFPMNITWKLEEPAMPYYLKTI